MYEFKCKFSELIVIELTVHVNFPMPARYSFMQLMESGMNEIGQFSKWQRVDSNPGPLY